MQYGVEGMTPSMLSALRGCWRYAIAAAMSASPFVIPGDLAKSIILSATSCWSQMPPVERSALMPARPASSTHGWFVKISPPLSSYITPNTVWSDERGGALEVGNVHRDLASSARRQGGLPARCADSWKNDGRESSTRTATLERAIAACDHLGLRCQR